MSTVDSLYLESRERRRRTRRRCRFFSLDNFVCVCVGGDCWETLVLTSCKEVLSIALNHIFLLEKDDNTEML